MHDRVNTYIQQLLEQLDAQGLQEKSEVVRKPLLELKVELRSLCLSLAAISANEVSATQLRSLEGIRHLLASLGERASVLEEEIGDPARLARSIVADDVVARVRGVRACVGGEGGTEGRGGQGVVREVRQAG